MKEIEYTKGPWHTMELHNNEFPVQVESFSEDGNRTLCIRMNSFNLEADTNIVLAAPDMYEALLDARYALYGDGPGNPKIDAAIAKAQGRT